MAEIVSCVRPVLTGAGFRKRAHTFNRTVQPGLVQALTYQMGQPLPPGTEELPGLRESLHGLFTVEVGVFVEEAWRLEVGRFGPDGPPATKTWVNTHDCQLRRVLDDPAGRSTHLMWPLDDPDTGLAMVELLHGAVFPWLDGFGSRDAILTALENAPVDSYEISGEGPDRLLAARMRLGAGDHDRAQQHLDDWVGHCQMSGSDDALRHGHLDHLAEFASRVGLRIATARPSDGR